MSDFATRTGAGRASPRARSGLGHPATITYRGHRTYLDPNPRLIAARTKVSRFEAPKGHRRFVVL